MMHLLRKYDVAPLRSAMMRCLPQCAVRHTSLGEAVIIGEANIICRRQTSFKKRTFVGRQKCVFCWQGQKDSNPRPMVLETSTLPTELYPCVHFCNAQYYIIVFFKLQAFFQKNFIFFQKKKFGSF